MKTVNMRFKDIPVGKLFDSSGTIYRKINGRMGQIEMPHETYHGKKFYFGYNEWLKMSVSNEN